jgi:hypothetical protein
MCCEKMVVEAKGEEESEFAYLVSPKHGAGANL